MPASLLLEFSPTLISLTRVANDDSPQGVVITATEDGNFLFGAENGTSFTVPGFATDVALVNTADIPGFNFPDNGTTKLVVEFGSGDDIFYYDGASEGLAPRRFGDLRFDLGAGNDEFSLVQIHGGRTKVTSASSIDLTDDDFFNILAGGTNPPFQPGPGDYYGGSLKSLEIVGATGSDSVYVVATISNNLEISLSDGDDLVELQSTTRIGGSVVYRTPSPARTEYPSLFRSYSDVTIGRNLSISTSNTMMDILVEGTTLGGSIRVKGFSNSEAFSSLMVSDSTLGGDILFRSGRGEDEFRLSGSIVSGSVTTNNGGGGTIGGDLIANSTIGKNLTIKNGGRGEDFLEIRDTVVSGDTSIHQGNDGDYHYDYFNLERSTFGGNFTFSAGAGGATVRAVDSDFFGSAHFGSNQRRYESSYITAENINVAAALEFRQVYSLFATSVSADSLKVTSQPRGYADWEISGSHFREASLRSGRNEDTINIFDGTTILGRLDISTGGEYDTVYIRNAEIGTFSLNLGSQSDILIIRGNTRFLGDVSLRTGTGSDDVYIDPSPLETITFMGHLNLVTGTENDTVGIGLDLGVVEILGEFKYVPGNDDVWFGPNVLT